MNQNIRNIIYSDIYYNKKVSDSLHRNVKHIGQIKINDIILEEFYIKDYIRWKIKYLKYNINILKATLKKLQK